MSPSLCEDSFLQRLWGYVHIAFTSTKSSTRSDAKSLAKNWSIGLETVRRTLYSTTQRVLRTVAHASLSRRSRTNDRQLIYKRINSEMFINTAQLYVISKRGNKCMQVFSMPNAWIRVFPITKKSCAHDALSILFKRDGVPSSMVMDGSKEQTLGEL